MSIARVSSLFLSVALLAACASEPAADGDTATADPAASVDSTAMAAPSGPKLNLNTASADEFMTVPEVGDRMAREFDEYRPYVSIAQFRQEMGKYVEPEQIAGYEQYVFVPVSPNESDAETLAQIPGLDAASAATLIAARPFDSNDAFLTALEPLVSADLLPQAASYLVSE